MRVPDRFRHRTKLIGSTICSEKALFWIKATGSREVYIQNGGNCALGSRVSYLIEKMTASSSAGRARVEAETARMERMARRLIVAAAVGLVAMAVMGIVLTHDAWPMLRQGLVALVDGGPSSGTLPMLGAVAALVLFAGAVLQRARRATRERGRTSFAAAWLAIAYIVFCSLMLTASWLQAHSVRNDFRAERLEQQAAVARLKAQQIDDWAYERGIDINFLASTLKTLPLDDIERHPEIQQLAEVVLAQFLSGHAERIAVVLSDAQGRPLVSAGTVPAQAQEAFTREMREAARRRLEMRGEIHAGGARPDGLTVAFLVPFAVPSRGGTVELVAAALIDPTIGLLRTFTQWPTSSRSSELELVFRQGSDIVHIVPRGPTPASPLSFRIPTDRQGLVAHESRRGTAVAEGADHYGHTVVAALQDVAAFPWIVVAKTDTDEAMLPLERQVANIWLMTGAMIVFAGLFMLALWFQLRLTESLRAARLA